MNSDRTEIGFRIGFSAAAAVLVLAGASLNASGRDTAALAGAATSGLLALGAGVIFRRWRFAVPLGAAAIVLSLVIAQFNPLQGDLVLQLAGLLLLRGGGPPGGPAFRRRRAPPPAHVAAADCPACG